MILSAQVSPNLLASIPELINMIGTLYTACCIGLAVVFIIVAIKLSLDTALSLASLGIILICIIPIAMLMAFKAICMWKAYTKAGHPGWTCLVPIYDLYIMCRIAGKPGWLVILLLIPYLNFIVMILLGLEISRQYNKSPLFGLGIGSVILSPIFWAILSFGDAKYAGTQTTELAKPETV